MTPTQTGASHLQNRINAIFPVKLHRLLAEAESQGYADVISWLPDGMNFMVHDKARFSAEVMPLYFGSTKHRSFQKSLNMWGFKATRSGPKKGACSHPLFKRDSPFLSHRIVRQPVYGKEGTKDIDHHRPHLVSSSPVLQDDDRGASSRCGGGGRIAQYPPQKSTDSQVGILHGSRSRQDCTMIKLDGTNETCTSTPPPLSDVGTLDNVAVPAFASTSSSRLAPSGSPLSSWLTQTMIMATEEERITASQFPISTLIKMTRRKCIADGNVAPATTRVLQSGNDSTVTKLKRETTAVLEGKSSTTNAAGQYANLNECSWLTMGRSTTRQPGCIDHDSHPLATSTSMTTLTPRPLQDARFHYLRQLRSLRVLQRHQNNQNMDRLLSAILEGNKLAEY